MAIPFLPEPVRIKTRNDPRLAGFHPLYRFFDDAGHAADFCRGAVFVTTLEKCRKTEDAARADTDEATHRYSGGTAIGSEGDPYFEEIAQRSGIDTRGARNWTISDNRNSQRIHDAYLLCLTTRCDQEAMAKFGKHCVEIRTPKDLFFRMVLAVSSQISTTVHAAGLVDYRERTYAGMDPEPGQLGFVKPMRYSGESEVRFLVLPEQGVHSLQPKVFEFGDMSGDCVQVR